MIKIIITSTILCFSLLGLSQDITEKNNTKLKPFIAYDFGEAAFNRFQSYSGEIGIRFPNHHLLRLTHMNVNLTEQHLSSSFAAAVDGPNVEGKFFGFELFYDIPIYWNKLYLGPSVGYYENEYSHTILSERLKKETVTVGLGISYREIDLFGIKGLYYTFSIPMRLSLSPIEETKLGETIIVNDTFNNNIWLFVGYEF